MELTLENLVDEIVELEYSCYLARNYAEKFLVKNRITIRTGILNCQFFTILQKSLIFLIS